MADAVIAYLHPGTVRAEFCASLLAVCMEGSTRIRTVIALESGPNLSTGRNLACRNFLEDGLAPWLFMCDTDMWFPADTVDRLIGAADPAQRPVVGGLCWSLDGGRRYPVMYELAQGPAGELAFTRYRDWPGDAVLRVSATGAAALLIHRDALQAVEKAAGDPAAPWFRESAVGAPMALMGEDMTFCLRCAAAGIPVHVATGVKVGHMKTTMLIQGKGSLPVHASALAFATTALDSGEVRGKTVIEAGAMDVNGSARPAVEAHGPASYTGTDMQPGPRVDVVCAAQDLPERFGEESADVVLSTEMLEHAADWQAALAGMIAVLKPGGVLVLTARGPGFPRHGYPDDHWRFPAGVMRDILEAAGLGIDRCEPDSDPASPGVFAKARKPDGRVMPRGDLPAAWADIEVPGV